jgi:benzoate membrane transport protein
MSAAPAPRLLADSSVSALVAGFIAMLTGHTSGLVLIFQAGQAAGLSDLLIASWIWALSLGMAVCTIGLSLYYRAPIVVAWSTPGAALLISSLPGVSFSEAIGAYLLCAVLLTLVGLTGTFERLMRHLPASLAAALLAGILFRIASAIFGAAEQQSLLVLSMLASYLIFKRLQPRYAVLAALLVGCSLAYQLGLLDLSAVPLSVALPQWTTPSFTFNAAISIGLPLFVVAMASQNIPGLAVLRADGYNVPASPLLSATGIASFLLAPLGAHGVNLAAITAAICTGPHAHEDPRKRYTAAVFCGLFYALAGLFGASLVALFAALPSALLLSVAAIALLGSIGNGLSVAMQAPNEREAALLTFMVSASGISFFGIGSAFWGLVAGVVTLLIVNAGKRY